MYRVLLSTGFMRPSRINVMLRQVPSRINVRYYCLSIAYCLSVCRLLPLSPSATLCQPPTAPVSLILLRPSLPPLRSAAKGLGYKAKGIDGSPSVVEAVQGERH